jgi:thiamine pyrophosphate-dependent acetolactate synthase large subunit-like protein
MLPRYVATQYLAGRLRDELVVASLGNAKYDLFLAGDRPLNFYLWNSMGMACSMALGLAMAQPQRRVIVLDGDGALLMNLGSLATEAVAKPANLIHIVWDNRQYQLTGGQPTHTAFGTDLARIAEGAGLEQVERVETLEAFRSAFDRAMSNPGPWFILALVGPEASPGRPPKSPTFIKHRFMAALGVSH